MIKLNKERMKDPAAQRLWLELPRTFRQHLPEEFREVPDVVASETPLQLLQAVKGKVTSVKVQLALNAMNQRVQSLVDSEFALLARYVRDMIRIEHINTYISLSQWLEMDISLDLIKSRLANIPSLDIELKRQLGSKDPTFEEMCDRVGPCYLTSKMHINAISIEHSPKNESGLVRAGARRRNKRLQTEEMEQERRKRFQGKGKQTTCSTSRLRLATVPGQSASPHRRMSDQRTTPGEKIAATRATTREWIARPNLLS